MHTKTEDSFKHTRQDNAQKKTEDILKHQRRSFHKT